MCPMAQASSTKRKGGVIHQALLFEGEELTSATFSPDALTTVLRLSLNSSVAAINLHYSSVSFLPLSCHITGTIYGTAQTSNMACHDLQSQPS
jgi:hypothetical protein